MNQQTKERCARCGDIKVLAGYRGKNIGYFCEDCGITLSYEEEREKERNDQEKK